MIPIGLYCCKSIIRIIPDAGLSNFCEYTRPQDTNTQRVYQLMIAILVNFVSSNSILNEPPSHNFARHNIPAVVACVKTGIWLDH